MKYLHIHFFQSNKRGKPSLELQMEDETSYTLAADTEAEINDWLIALQRVIQSNEQGSIDKYKGEFIYASHDWILRWIHITGKTIK